MQDLEERIQEVKSSYQEELKKISSLEELEDYKKRYFGKKGLISTLFRKVGELPPSLRKEVGEKIHRLREKILEEISSYEELLKREFYEKELQKEWWDPTLLPQKFPQGYSFPKEKGHIHPISQVQRELEKIFLSMGFSILDGPQVETDFYNFSALNFTEDHPAREMQDTIYTEEDYLLRTHTSAVQVRAMEKFSPPLRILVPGRVFRFEEVDASHEHTFYQVEGMIIDKHISVAHLLFLMKTLLREIFHEEVKVRFRPGYFPFVEPGFELDMFCLLCQGKGCSVCKGTSWIEVLPCGLVHPNVLRAGGIDPNKWQGAAFGLGLNRLVMLLYGIEDIRYFQSSSLSFLRQF